MLPTLIAYITLVATLSSTVQTEQPNSPSGEGDEVGSVLTLNLIHNVEGAG